MDVQQAGYDDGVDIFPVKQAPMIVIHWRIFTGDFARGGEAQLIDVAESGETDSGYTQKRAHQLLTAAANPDNAEVDPVRCAELLMSGYERSEACAEIHDEVDRVLDRWRNTL